MVRSAEVSAYCWNNAVVFRGLLLRKKHIVYVGVYPLPARCNHSPVEVVVKASVFFVESLPVKSGRTSRESVDTNMRVYGYAKGCVSFGAWNNVNIDETLTEVGKTPVRTRVVPAVRLGKQPVNRLDGNDAAVFGKRCKLQHGLHNLQVELRRAFAEVVRRVCDNKVKVHAII